MFVHKMDHDRRMKHVQVLGADGQQETQCHDENIEGATELLPPRPTGKIKLSMLPPHVQQPTNKLSSKNDNDTNVNASRTDDEDTPSESHQVTIEIPELEAKYPVTTHLSTNVSNTQIFQSQANLPSILSESSFMQSSSAAVKVHSPPAAITVSAVKSPSISELKPVTISETDDLSEHSEVQENMYPRDM
jgi:hypothetical protein